MNDELDSPPTVLPDPPEWMVDEALAYRSGCCCVAIFNRDSDDYEVIHRLDCRKDTI